LGRRKVTNGHCAGDSQGVACVVLYLNFAVDGDRTVDVLRDGEIGDSDVGGWARTNGRGIIVADNLEVICRGSSSDTRPDGDGGLHTVVGDSDGTVVLGGGDVQDGVSGDICNRLELVCGVHTRDDHCVERAGTEGECAVMYDEHGGIPHDNYFYPNLNTKKGRLPSPWFKRYPKVCSRRIVSQYERLLSA
jgi:hypothetical protein